MAEADLMKRCTRCNENKPISAFNRRRQGRHGVGSWCRPCFKVYNVDYRAKNLERERERSRGWAEKNKDRVIASVKADRLKRPDHFREYRRSWRAQNQEKAAEHDARKRAKRIAGLAAPDADFTAEQWREVMAEYDYRCAYCGAPGFLEKDHVIPLSRGGKHVRSNIVPACGPCNASKNNRTPAEWMAARGEACLKSI